MISTELVVYCLVLGGAALLVVTVLYELLGRIIKASRDMPVALIEPTSPAWYLLNFVMEYLFLVAVPTFAYLVFVVALPLEGIKPALAAAVMAFTLGAAPTLLAVSVRIKLSVSYLLYILLGVLLKLAAVMATIGYLYSL
ncbi:MAG: hypothetical protein OEV49_05880 [candidate division Zixibacteria bacterium]|nr:hypothetical protein [candidate division Zixibacteria bacterium]MDH4035088.1 hypothetical protein [candidate division Zixibacteria bacterium]